jgi:GT2 family glycosyltransferase
VTGASLGAVVVSYESAAELPACLEALLRAAPVAAVVVVDNASRDGSVAVAGAVSDPRLELLALRENLGFAGGCNRGLEALSSELPYVAFLNPDVAVSPGCLERCVARLEREPGLAGVAPMLLRPDGSTVDSVGQVLDRFTLEVRDRGYGQRLTPELLTPSPVLAACGALAVFRRAALESVASGGGPWAEHYFCFWEDLELGWRLANSGFKIVSLPDAVAVHGRGAGAAPGSAPLRWRRPPELEACVLTNRWMTLIRHLHPLDSLPRLPLLLAWDLSLTVAGILHRPALLAHLRRRWPLVVREWRERRRTPRRRLGELPR